MARVSYRIFCWGGGGTTYWPSEILGGKIVGGAIWINFCGAVIRRKLVDSRPCPIMLA